MAFNKPKSLSKILSVFENVKADLVEFVGQEVDNVTIKTQEAARLNSEVTEHNDNILRANEVMLNIDTLLGTKTA